MRKEHSYIEAAFKQVVADSVTARASYVSLYLDTPFYGGPEEGGWWGSDTELVEYRRCETEAEAAALKDAVGVVAEKLSERARRAFNAQCAAQIEWIEENDPLCDDESVYFPEPDGELRYWVAVEDRPGSFVRVGDRCYS